MVLLTEDKKTKEEKTKGNTQHARGDKVGWGFPLVLGEFGLSWALTHAIWSRGTDLMIHLFWFKSSRSGALTVQWALLWRSMWRPHGGHLSSRGSQLGFCGGHFD